MRITSDNGAGHIHKAESDDGRVQYWPIGNDRVLIDGRDAYRGRYADGSAVAAADWDDACALTAEVDAANRSNSDALRQQAWADEDDRRQRVAASLAGTRGTYADRNTY